ncbi:MAG TPA: protein O-GlcNAcase [Gaiellaceae bacterium]|nr:protein O-GlcNAcase [Gaiellaceae bacterium]
MARALAVRGVIEGFYGPPWSHAERLDLIRFCGEHGFTHWVHAPKDDPYHRARWREPYPDADLARLGELAAAADRAGVSFTYAIAPGLDLDHEREADFAALLDKRSQVCSVGVHGFQLLWDDIESRDGAAQAAFTNRVAAALDQPGPLVVCPVGYAGTESTPYRRAFAPPLAAEIVVYWTGPEVVSHAIAREELDVAVERFAGHELLLWDNYPVNDFAPETLFLGPLLGRDPRLAEGRCAGIVANAMVQAIPSKLALATVADWARDPFGYDPLASFERAVAAYGAEVVGALGTAPADVERPRELAGLARALRFGVDAATAVALLEPFV